MVSYQTSILWSELDGTALTGGSVRLELWKLWNDGNYAWCTRKVNGLVERWAARMANLSTGLNGKVDLSSYYFVSCSIGEDSWVSIAEAYPTADSTFDFLASALADGLKVSFSVNAKNDMTICSVTDKREGSASFGACLTGGADGWYDALRVVAYKYTVLLQGDLRRTGSKPDSGGRIS